MNIETLKKYYEDNLVFMSQHASDMSRQRDITQEDIRNCILTGEIIEQYPDDYPYPSCLIYGYASDNRVIHVVACDNGEYSKIITAYIPNMETFNSDLKTRKEH